MIFISETYNPGHNILELHDIFSIFSSAASETECDYSEQKEYILNPERLSTKNLRKS